MGTSPTALMQKLPGGQDKWLRLSQRGANLLLIVLCAVSLARIIWALWPAEIQTSQLPVLNTGTDQQASQQVNLSVIYNNHLFGRAEIKKEQSPESAPVDAPETRLNLVLTGIMSASDGQHSRALIKDGSGKQRPYGIGDDLPGNAKLSAIHSDRVILERAGRYETLRMEQKDGKTTPSSSRRTSSRTASAPLPGEAGISAETAAKLSEARNEILQDPTKASQYIRVQPVYNQGQLQGYRVYPGRDRALFKDMGLRAGELLTSVNGIQLDDPTKALQMLTDLSQASDIAVTLERAGQSRTLNINLNQ